MSCRLRLSDVAEVYTTLTAAIAVNQQSTSRDQEGNLNNSAAGPRHNCVSASFEVVTVDYWCSLILHRGSQSTL